LRRESRASQLGTTEAEQFIAALRRARIVLCNPPFEDFTEAEKREYSPSTPRKPAEVLSIVLNYLHPDGVLGFVLPAAFLEGQSYRASRRRLAERFQRLEVVRLPDKVFERAEFPCALLLATHPARGRHNVSVSFAAVADEGKFLRTGDVGYMARQTRTVAEVQRGIAAPALAELWEFLEPCAKLSDAVSALSRGVQWKGFDKDKHVSVKPKRGYVPGFHTASKLYSFQPPPLVYLWNGKESRERRSWDLPWNEPKVIVNAVRKARQPWRLAACPVELNILASQNFTVGWPVAPWTPNSLAAVLNGPVAAAYVASHENWKHNKKKTLAAIPLPDLSDEEIRVLDDAVLKYRKAASLAESFGEQAGLFGGAALQPVMERLLQVIDVMVLRGYRLPPALRAQLFAYFGSHPRPVPFPSDITAVERGIRELPANPTAETEENHDKWELFRRAVEDDRYPQRRLFRWRN
jgi:hypothetical protein